MVYHGEHWDTMHYAMLYWFYHGIVYHGIIWYCVLSW